MKRATECRPLGERALSKGIPQWTAKITQEFAATSFHIFLSLPHSSQIFSPTGFISQAALSGKNLADSNRGLRFTHVGMDPVHGQDKKRPFRRQQKGGAPT